MPEVVISSSIEKSWGPPCAGRAQTSSSVKSGAISRIRQGRDSCAAFGILMLILDPYGSYISFLISPPFSGSTGTLTDVQSVRARWHRPKGGEGVEYRNLCQSCSVILGD